uniref:Uncharacterized protein n=1 Tax=Corethron hystrix TaxID=216773 RepID=A0A7S1FPR2_9STRA|mmetsp:Transcript_21256/g.48290  ORF Transcript_21256/g.48290 Transcript_21256/m.48290 type:complete len:472 (+) Transcript_21256:241-1656(+)
MANARLAHFSPTYPLSLYLYGVAGSGKSAFVRAFAPALQSSIALLADPEVLVRPVKQNLNKPLSDLDLEFELRPNNNDLSIMSIVQGRRMTLTQTRPGLVALAMEEMPQHDALGEADPHQHKVCNLIARRFGGLKGGGKGARKGTAAPRNSEGRGIGNDPTILTLFTSNYPLEPMARSSLLSLKMFHNLLPVKVHPISGSERIRFARSYLGRCVDTALVDQTSDCSVAIDDDVLLPQGDIRALVRHLRMLSFHGISLLRRLRCTAAPRLRVTCGASPDDVVLAAPGGTVTLRTDGKVLVPDILSPMDPRTVAVAGAASPPAGARAALAHVLDLYFGGALAPAVVVSRDADLVRRLVSALGSQDTVCVIPGIDPEETKMLRSLYDPRDLPNLRDDIMSQLMRRDGSDHLVVTELICRTADAQMMVREMIEDGPSMTAFSTKRSALHKDGLFFGVWVKGEITPEILSRASIVI